MLLRIPSILLLLAFGPLACTDKKPQEAVNGGSEIPAAPPEGANAANLETVYFAFDSSFLTEPSRAKLEALATSLKSNNISIQIAGHCDERGTVQYNLSLGERRAHSVKQFLVDSGVAESRITTISYGEEKPAVEGHDESAWSKNRRAEFVVTAR